MENYLPQLSDFLIRKEKVSSDGLPLASFSAAELPAGNICPYLLHILIPYMKTFSEEGIFHWMSHDNPDKVVLSCPNARDCVVCDLRRGKNKKGEVLLEVEVIAIKGHCLFNHAPGQRIFLPSYQSHKDQYHIFNTIFPWVVVGVGLKKSFNISLCLPEFYDHEWHIFFLEYKSVGSDILADPVVCSSDVEGKLILKSCQRRCRYHKRPRRECYSSMEIVPNGLCPDFFHAVYPWILAKLYEKGLTLLTKEVFQDFLCPNTNVRMRMKMCRKPLKSAWFRLFILRFLNAWGWHLDWPFYEVSMEITNENFGCLRQHRIGQRFFMNLGEDRSMCPAAFDALYPFWHAISRGVNMKRCFGEFFQDGGIQCPDVVSKNIYQWRSGDLDER